MKSLTGKDKLLEKCARIYVAGTKTLIGAGILHELDRQGYGNVVARPGEEPELTDPDEVEAFFTRTRPEYVFMAAGRSGGIGANQKYPAELMLDNLLAECHVLRNAYRQGVKKLLYLASSCCYPERCPQPMQEKYLLTGLLEPTSEAYALSKIAGMKLCQAFRKQYKTSFISVIPADCFGPADNFSLEDSHVVPAMMYKIHEAMLRHEDKVVLWGSGKARRDFIYVEDMARACIFALTYYDDNAPINLGSGHDWSIAELARNIQETTGFRGELFFDTTRPDGMPVKLLDSRKIQELGWRAEWPLKEALKKTWSWFVSSGAPKQMDLEK